MVGLLYALPNTRLWSRLTIEGRLHSESDLTGDAATHARICQKMNLDIQPTPRGRGVLQHAGTNTGTETPQPTLLIDALLGTGFTGRDVTPEALEPLFEKRMDGFSQVFHMQSYGKIGTSTIQSRATAGVAKGTYLFALPGSPGACRDAWDEILVHQLDIRFRPCNFVELMPRLQEK